MNTRTLLAVILGFLGAVLPAVGVYLRYGPEAHIATSGSDSIEHGMVLMLCMLVTFVLGILAAKLSRQQSKELILEDILELESRPRSGRTESRKAVHSVHS